MNTCYVGADPGTTGALGWVAPNETAGVLSFDAKYEPSIYQAVVTLYETAQRQGWRIFLRIEKVASMPGQGVVSTFKFGRATGIIIGAAGALGIPYEELTPSDWKGRFTGLICPGKSDAERKARSREMATQRFPELSDQFNRVKDHNAAEAILIALSAKEDGR